MSKFKIMSVVIVLFEITIIIICNMLCVSQFNTKDDRLYRVEAKRVSDEIGEKGLNSINLNEYNTLVNISEYSSKENICNDYLISEVDGKLYCIEYVETDTNKVSIYMNITFVVLIMLTVMVLIYVQSKLLRPFNNMQHLSEELARGNLSVPIKEEKSKFFGRFLWGMDMLRENLEDKKKKELELQKEKKTLILSLSHDIKTPLSAIELYTKALQEGLYDTEEKRKDALNGIIKNTGDIKNYVNEITKASREDFLNLTTNNGELYLYEMLEKIKIYYSEKLSVLHTRFDVEEVSNCLICGDLDRLVEVMQNIIENAIKYGDGDHISISFDDEEDCKLITIENTGDVPDKEEIPHLFDSFYRGSNHGNAQGSGLGLYICKHLMLKMNGDIFVKTNENTFAITVVIKKA